MAFLGAFPRQDIPFPDTIPWWIDQYFVLHSTSSWASQRIARRDLNLFSEFLLKRSQISARRTWTPMESILFFNFIKKHYSDRTSDRIIAHLKKFSKWIHKVLPFRSGDPMIAIGRLGVGKKLNVHSALTRLDRKKILAAADRLLKTPVDKNDWRKGSRPFRNRAIIYTLIETGMSRAGLRNVDLANVDFRQHAIHVHERGATHTYEISRVGMKAIVDYLNESRLVDSRKWNRCPALFLTAETVRLGDGRLTPAMINCIWNQVCASCGVSGKTPHSARHAMGKHIMSVTRSAAAVQKQLGHRSAHYAVQYSSIEEDSITEAINNR